MLVVGSPLVISSRIALLVVGSLLENAFQLVKLFALQYYACLSVVRAIPCFDRHSTARLAFNTSTLDSSSIRLFDGSTIDPATIDTATIDSSTISRSTFGYSSIRILHYWPPTIDTSSLQFDCQLNSHGEVKQGSLIVFVV